MPATRTTASKAKPAGAPSSDRKHSQRGKRSESQLHGSVDALPGKNHSVMRDDKPSALKISMRGINGVHVDLATMPKGVCLLDDESKLLKALEDLLPIAESIKGFKDNNRWSDKSSTSEVFYTFLNKAFHQMKADAMRLILKDGTYRFMVKSAIYFDVVGPHMPVYWISHIQKKEVYDLCFYLVAYMYRHCHVDLWDDINNEWVYNNIQDEHRHYNGYKKSELSDEAKKDALRWEQAVREYDQKGIATQFYNKISRANCSPRMWLKEFNQFKPSTQLEKDIHAWLSLGKQLMQSGERMSDYIHIPDEIRNEEEYQDEWPLTPDQAVKFMYRADDAFTQIFIDGVQAQESNAGGLPFYADKVLEKPGDFKLLENCFAQTLLYFLASGRKLEKKYRSLWENEKALAKAFQSNKQVYLVDIL